MPPLLVIPVMRPTSSSCSSKYGSSLRGIRSKLSGFNPESRIASLAMIRHTWSVVYPLRRHTPHVPWLQRPFMLPQISGCIHLSVAGGCGGTTCGLQYAREILDAGNHVVWICDSIPDGARFSQIFSDVSPSAVSKLHLSAVGDNTEIGINSAIDLMRVLQNIKLVVIDDWTAKTGRVSSTRLKAMHKLIDQCISSDVKLIAISSAYEDAGGTGWKSRGNLAACETWFLHRSPVDSMMRELHINGNVTQYILSDEGFTLRR
jgi:hypothetical protein